MSISKLFEARGLEFNNWTKLYSVDGDLEVGVAVPVHVYPRVY